MPHPGAAIKAAIKRIAPPAFVQQLARLQRALVLLRYRGDVTRAKSRSELSFWRRTLRAGQPADNTHYAHFFTTFFGLTPADYAGMRVLDVGCGPRGSLEWASGVRRRIGLDPLARDYRAFGTARHAMGYVSASSAAMPLADRAFDIVASFNSLDHVDDLRGTLDEIERVLAPGGRLLLIVEVNHEATLTEPVTFSWEIVSQFPPALLPRWEAHFEKPAGPIYESLDRRVPFDHANLTKRPGLLCALLEKTSGSCRA